MATPIYNDNIMPCPTYPMTHTKINNINTFGGVVSTGLFVDMQFMARSDAELIAYNNFRDIDCAMGSSSFFIDVPVMGGQYSSADGVELLWAGGTTYEKKHNTWVIGQKFRVVGVSSLVVDSNGNTTVANLGISDITGLQAELNALNANKSDINHIHDGGSY